MRTLKPSVALLLILLLALAAAACTGGRTRDPAAPQERTTVRVENRKFLDVNVYVLEGGQRRRLGTVPGISSRVFTIPPSLIFGMATLRFQVDPIGSGHAPISQEITVREGDEIILTVPS